MVKLNHLEVLNVIKPTSLLKQLSINNKHLCQDMVNLRIWMANPRTCKKSGHRQRPSKFNKKSSNSQKTKLKKTQAKIVPPKQINCKNLLSCNLKDLKQGSK